MQSCSIAVIVTLISVALVSRDAEAIGLRQSANPVVASHPASKDNDARNEIGIVGPSHVPHTLGQRTDSVPLPNPLGSVHFRDCEKETIKALGNVTKMSNQALTDKNSNLPGNREEPMSAAAEVWCQEKLLGMHIPNVPESVSLALCHGLKEKMDRFVDEESAKGVKHYDVKVRTRSAKAFCEEAKRVLTQVFSNEIAEEDLAGTDLFKRFQVDPKGNDGGASSSSNKKIVAEFYGNRAHNSLEEGHWDDASACCTVHETKGCKDASISLCVCEKDAFCCQNSWDVRCVKSVSELGCGKCPEISTN